MGTTGKELLTLDSLEILPFSDQDQKNSADFCTAIFEEMGWKVSYLDGIDDIPAFFHFPDGVFLVVKDKTRVVGCAGVKPLSNDIGLVKRFYVASELRGSGIAAQLLTKLIEESRKRGFEQLVLDVYFKNPRATAFYEKYGFQKYEAESSDEWSESKEPEKYFYYKLNIG